MVDISSQNNKINITVSSSGNTANTNVTPDYAQYYSEKSKEWAISNKIVDNTDYSSKHYANESKKQADISTAKTTEVVESGNNAVSNIESARDNAIIDITNQESLSVDNVNTAGATQVSSVNTAGITQVANVNSAGTTQINLAKEQVTLATNQANIATEQATIATNKTSEVVASGNEALNNIDTAKNNALTTITTQETTSKNNVITTGNEQVARIEATGNNYDNLTHKNITNCLLEVPQRIKLELNDGTLTLKAGSQVIVPNGFEADGTTPKFDEVVIDNDLTVTNLWGTAEKMAIFVSTNATAIYMVGLARLSSGTTAPTTTNTRYWYDTNTNLVKTYNGGSYSGNNCSFPIAICTKTSASNDNLLASIDQVFNGMGYIGSTVWVDKGVKGLAPNGRNADGTLNSVEWEIDKIKTFTDTSTHTNAINFCYNAGSQSFQVMSPKNWSFDEDANIWKHVTAGDQIVTKLGSYTGTGNASGSVANFNSNKPFRAVDYNDFRNTPSIQAPYLKDTYVNGTSGYRIWSDGYCEQWGVANYPKVPANTAKLTTITFLKKFANVNYCVSHNIITDGGNTTGLRNHQLNLQVGTLQFGWYSTTSTAGGGTFCWRASGYLANGQY